MSRLFSCICNEPRRLPEALEPVRDRLVAHAEIAGWGLGYAQSGEVLLRRHPQRAKFLDCYETLRDVHSDYIICQTSSDTTYTGTANTQPFRYRSWMYAQTGTVVDFAPVRAALQEHIPDFMRRSIRGNTPAEHCFHLFLAFLHDNGQLDDPNLPLARSREALRDAAALVLSLVTKHGTTGGTGNIIASNCRTMIAVRLGGPLHVRRFNGSGSPEGKDFKGLLILSDADEPGEGFETIPDHSALLIHRDLQSDIVPLDS